MTLKTSLIITGDSATAKAAVDALTDSVNKLGKAGGDTAAPASAMGAAIGDAADKARDATQGLNSLDDAIGGVAGSAEDLASAGGALSGALGDISSGARGAIGDAGALDGALGRVVGAIGDTASKALGLDGALSTVGGSARDASGLASELEGTLGDLAQGALSSATAQGAIAKASGVAATAMAGLGVSATAVEGVLTGGLSLVLPIVIGFLAGFADEALEGAAALGEQEQAAVSLTEEIEALNRALEKETQTQYSARVAALAHAEGQRALAIETANARKALLQKAIAEQKATPSWAPAGPGQAIQQAASMAANAKVADLEGQLKDAETALAGYNRNVAIQRRYFVDRGIAAGADPRARAQLTYDQGLDRLDRRRSQISETQYAREKAQLDRERAAALDALSKADDRATASSRRSSAARGAASAADRDAADAVRKLQADLDSVIGRYDPAAKAASDYADELERIARLAQAGKISGDDAANYSAQASAAYLGKAIDWNAIKGAAGDEQAAIDASAAIDKIVQGIEDEAAAIATLNPLQRELLGYRGQLANLAPEDRAAAEARISGALAEKAAIEQVADATREARQAQEQLGNLAIDAFSAIVTGGQKASDVISRLAETIAAAALQATIFGTGPLAAMLNGAALPKGSAQAQGAVAADLVGKSVGKSVEGAMDKAFDARGKFASVLKNAGMGNLAGGVAGSRTGGAIGGAIGGAVGKELLGSALGSLGQFAGPIGAIAGGLLGGAIGGLFKKSKTGSATIGNVDGQGSVTGTSGNSAAYRKQSAGMAGEVLNSLDQIVQQLGGALGNFSVSVGYKKSSEPYRVDTTGQGRVKGAGVLYFTDEAEAQAAALANAIADGAVGGVSDAVRRALTSSDDVSKAVQEALKVQQVEALLGGLGAEMAQQFKGLEAQAKERVRIATEYGFDVVAIEKKNAEDRVKLVDQILKDRVGSLQSLLDDMDFGSLAEGSVADQRTKLLAEIAKARGDAEAGVDGAADKLATLSRSLIDLTRDKLGTAGGEYATDRSTVSGAAQAVIAAEKSRVSAASAEQAKTNAKLDETNQTLDELATQQAEANATLAAIRKALETQNPSSSGAGGSSVVRSIYERTQEL